MRAPASRQTLAAAFLTEKGHTGRYEKTGAREATSGGGEARGKVVDGSARSVKTAQPTREVQQTGPIANAREPAASVLVEASTLLCGTVTPKNCEPWVGTPGSILSRTQSIQQRQPIRTIVPYLGQLKTTGHGSLDVNNGGWRVFEGVEHGAGNVSVTLAGGMKQSAQLLQKAQRAERCALRKPNPSMWNGRLPQFCGRASRRCPNNVERLAKCEGHAVVRMPQCDQDDTPANKKCHP